MYQLIDLSQENPQLTLEQAMSIEEVKKTFETPPVKEGIVSRQAVDGNWRDRRMILHTHSLLFLDVHGVAIDCIPTYQITEVSRHPQLDLNSNGETELCIAITHIPSRKPPHSQKEFDKIREESQHYETRTYYCRIPAGSLGQSQVQWHAPQSPLTLTPCRELLRCDVAPLQYHAPLFVYLPAGQHAYLVVSLSWYLHALSSHPIPLHADLSMTGGRLGQSYQFSRRQVLRGVGHRAESNSV